MKKLLVILIAFLISALAYAEVKVPGFAFTGQEISAYSIKPSFKNISVSFSVQSSFDTYLRQESFRLKSGEKKDYQSEDPGGIYSGGFGTSLSSVFVGERAYRNNIVKAFLDKEYLDVIESYSKYEEKLKGTAFEEETRLVYAFALLQTGSISKAMDIMKNIAVKGKNFRIVAADRVAEYLMNIKAFEELDIFASSLDRQTEYSLYAWLYSLLNLERYDRLVKVFNENSETASKDKRFYDFYISARYSQGGFEDVINSAGYSTENTIGLVADAYLIKGERTRAREIIQKMPDEGMKTVLQAKSAVLNKDLVRAGELLSEFKNDEDRLNLLYFYVGKTFPNISTEFLSMFHFDSRINADYLKYYTGIYFLSIGENKRAIKYLEAVLFNETLLKVSSYYKGLAYSNLDRNRAERYFLKYIESSEDQEKIAVSRFMLAQIYYIAGSLDDALMLLADCEKDFCKILKARIFLDKNDFELAWINTEGVRGDDAALIRSTVLFHKKQYNAALKQLSLITTLGRDADYLKMLSWLKLENLYEAEAIYNRYSNDIEFVNSYLEHLFLNGAYVQVLKITEKNKGDFPLIRAKSLFSLGRLKEAAESYEAIIKSGKHSFDAWNGLLSAYSAMGAEEKYAQTARRITEVKSDFDKKDYLVYQTAAQALELKKTKLATVLLNYFFETFITSAYKNDAYLLRGKLFRDTGRIQQCLNDAELMLSEGKSEDALFLKGECLQAKKPAEALKIFEQMTRESGRFRDLGYSKLIELYSKPKDVLRAAEYFKEKDTGRYYAGLEKYLSLLGEKSLSENRKLLDRMIADRNPEGLAAAYYYMGNIEYNDKNYEQAAVMYMKSHYLFPASKYSRKSLMMTIESYKKLGKNKDIDILERKLKGMKR